MKITIRKKTNMEWLCLYIMAMPFCFAFLFEFLKLPDFLKFTLDIAWGLLMFVMLINQQKISRGYTKNILKVVLTFFLISLVVYILNYQSIFYYLWGVRNYLRFYVYFFACMFFVRQHSVQSYLRFFDVLFLLNFFVALFQYFVLDYSGDYLGGIFGVTKGCNGYLNIFLMIVITKSILCYMGRTESFSKCVLKLFMVLILVALSELKMFIIELFIIVILCAVFTRFSPKKLIIILISILGAVVAARVIAVLYPVFSEWFNIEKMIEYASTDKGYTSTGDLNRFTGITIVLNNFLPGFFEKLFGMGLGNCDYAAFDFLTSPFYQNYGSLNYVMLLSAFLVLETGIVGLIVYCSFFIAVFFGASKAEKEAPNKQLECKIAKVMSLMCLVLVIYNSALRVEPGYMMYFVLALPFIKNEDRKNVPGSKTC